MAELSRGENEKEDEINSTDSLSEEDFINQYPENGFGWMAPVDKDNEYYPKMKEIGERWNKIREKRPKPEEGMFKPELGDESSGRYQRDLMQEPYVRNQDGQIVDSRTSEPVRKGSPEWQELAKKNKLPLNQEDQRK